jgi:hypothetical protein
MQSWAFTFTSHLDPKLGEFFKPNQLGWLGADVALSTPTPHNGTFLWLWGDTLYGSLENGQRQIQTMPRNSISFVKVVRQQPTSQEYHIRVDSANPKDEHLGFFTPTPISNTTNWFWLFDAIYFGKSLYVIASEMATTSGPPPWNFATISTGIIFVEDPSGDPLHWSYTYHKFPHTQELVALWNGFAQDDHYVYLTGYHNADHNSPSILAKLEINHFRDLNWQEIEYWASNNSEARWESFHDGMTLAGIFSDFPPYKLRYHPYLRKWYTISMKGFAYDIHLLTAPQITGPWTNTKIFEIPSPWNGQGIFCYSLLAHPEFQVRENEIVFSFMSNGPWEDLLPNLWLYIPQFVRVEIN